MTDIRTALNEAELVFSENEPLAGHSTMRVGGIAKYFVDIYSIEELQKLISIIRDHDVKIQVLGGGSNTLFIGDFDGIVIRINIKGKEIIEETDNQVTLRVAGGENWHDFVEFCANNNWAGNENLAYIPGKVGAAPVQNIGAYGQVQEDTFIRLEAIYLSTGETRIFEEPECGFAYRSSIFKTKEKSKYIITSVTYQLNKVDKYVPETSYYSRYDSLKSELSENRSEPYTLNDVFNAIVSIRKKKLPDVSEVGTLGSFFLNPFVSVKKLEELKIKYPEIQYHPVEKMQYTGLENNADNEQMVKIPAGWLLEELGWRGKRIGRVEASPKHALCVTALSEAEDTEVLDYIEQMKSSVKEATGIELQTEINIIKQ